MLDDTEQKAVATATTAFNSSLQAAANAKGLAYFDANELLPGHCGVGPGHQRRQQQCWLYISGNLFSLDGVHPTPRGYALIANEMDSGHQCLLRLDPGRSVNANEYRGVLLP